MKQYSNFHVVCPWMGESLLKVFSSTKRSLLKVFSSTKRSLLKGCSGDGWVFVKGFHPPRGLY